MVVTLTSSEIGSQFTVRNSRRGSMNIFNALTMTRCLFFIILPILLSPSCMPTTSIESGTVTSPINVTLSKSIDGR